LGVLLQNFQLEYRDVYCKAARALGECRYYSRVKALVSAIRDSGLWTATLNDQVVLAAIKAVNPEDQSQVSSW